MQKKEKHRIIIDTNLWISFLLTKDYSKIDGLLKNDLVVLLFSQNLIDEFIEVANRPKFKKYFTKIDLQDLLKKISSKAELIFVNSSIDICRDPKDNFLLSLACDGKATHLLTGDKDLLIIGIIGKTTITPITDYLLDK